MAPMIREKGNSTMWTSLFASNRSADNRLKLSYIPPKIIDGKIVVHLEKEEVEKEI